MDFEIDYLSLHLFSAVKYAIFSIDCELAWGYADHPQSAERVAQMRADPQMVRGVYRTILDLCDAHDIPATWAFVGHLFYDACDTDTHPKNMLTADADPHTSHAIDPLYYGSDLVNMVCDADLYHDIGGHSLTHPEFTALDRAAARAELETMVSVADSRGISLRSFVFPRNHVEHIDLLGDVGIEVYRTRTVGRNYILRSGLRRFFFDEQFWSVPPVQPEQTSEGVTRIKASRVLHELYWYWLHPVRLKRTIGDMGDGEMIHFTFHPHDMLSHYRLDWILKRVFKIIEQFRSQGELEVVTMRDIPDLA